MVHLWELFTVLLTGTLNTVLVETDLLLEMSQKLSYKKISMGILLIQEFLNFIQQKLEFSKVYGASGYKPQEHIPMVRAEAL